MGAFKAVHKMQELALNEIDRANEIPPSGLN
jgi:hypothetical protein